MKSSPDFCLDFSLPSKSQVFRQMLSVLRSMILFCYSSLFYIITLKKERKQAILNVCITNEELVMLELK